jgi:hypothetical protein
MLLGNRTTQTEHDKDAKLNALFRQYFVFLVLICVFIIYLKGRTMFINIHTCFRSTGNQSKLLLFFWLPRCFVFSIDHVLGCLYHVDVNIFPDVSEVHSTRKWGCYLLSKRRQHYAHQTMQGSKSRINIQNETFLDFTLIHGIGLHVHFQ